MSTRRAFSLVEILVVVVIMAVIAAVMMPRYLGGRTADGKKAPTPMSRARDTECMTNIRSVRQSIAAFSASDADERKPSSLTDMRELPESLRKCAVGGEPYQYDPNTAQVRCVHPGHESY